MKCPNLRQLCVSKCGELTDSTLVALANFNTHLSTLEVAGCHQFTDIGFQALGKVKCPLMCRELKMIHIYLFQNCKYLERMDLEECNMITDQTLLSLATGCPSLEKLVLKIILFIRLTIISNDCSLHRHFHIAN